MMKELASRVFVETDYRDVTVGAVLTDDGWVCIDAPTYPADAHAWWAALQAISPQPFLYVLVTDHHRDRVVGAAWFECPIVAHAHTARILVSQPPVQIGTAAASAAIGEETDTAQGASLKLPPPEISFSHSMVLHAGERALHLQHRPGAAQGSIWVLLNEERIVFTGDSVVIDQPPVITDGSVKSWLASLEMLRGGAFAGWIVVPGRGDVTTPAETELLSRYLDLARERVGALLHADRPRTEVGQLVPEMLALFTMPAGRQTEQFQRRIKAGLEAIYDELKQQPDGSDRADGGR
ncbi:MAG: MBL fold metallo-hydrolase [Anaerolineae bacterium]